MNRKKKNIALGLLIAWMVVIFVFSAMPGEVSSEQSQLLVSLFSFLAIDVESKFGEIAHFIVRKGAHFTEYAILYFLACNYLRYYFKSTKAYLMALAFVFLYACTDEFHQLFVEGRAGRFVDVLIDTIGGGFAMGVTYLLTLLKKGQRLI